MLPLLGRLYVHEPDVPKLPWAGVTSRTKIQQAADLVDWLCSR